MTEIPADLAAAPTLSHASARNGREAEVTYPSASGNRGCSTLQNRRSGRFDAPLRRLPQRRDPLFRRLSNGKHWQGRRGSWSWHCIATCIISGQMRDRTKFPKSIDSEDAHVVSMAVVNREPTPATISISTSAPIGKPATATVERAGLRSAKTSAYTSFIAAKSVIVVRNIVVLMTRSRQLPVSDQTSAMLARHWRVWAAMLPSTNVILL